MIDRPHLNAPVAKVRSSQPRNLTARQTGRCKTCHHPERALIESLLACGQSRISVARRFGLTQDTIYRHWLNHTYPSQRAAAGAKVLRPGVELEELATEENANLLQHLVAIRGKLHYVLDGAAESRNAHNVALIAGKLHENLRLIASLTGEIRQHSPANVTNVLVHPDFLEIMTAIRLACAKHPEARADIMAAFEKLEARALQKFNEPKSTPITIEGAVERAALSGSPTETGMRSGRTGSGVRLCLGSLAA